LRRRLRMPFGQVEAGRAQFIEGSETRHFGVHSAASSFDGANDGGGRLGKGP
jgi:hypothetical protein